MRQLSRSRAHRNWTALSRRLLIPFTMVALSTSLFGFVTPAGASPAASQPNHLPAAPKTASIPHRDFVPPSPSARLKAPQPPSKPVTWPAAGDVDVTLAAGAAAAVPATPSASPPTVRAGQLPILLGRANSTQNKAMSAQTGPTSVHVHVADQADAHKAGVDGVLFSVAPSTAGTSAGVSVGIDYSAFTNAGGADWSTRLHLVELPACALTTPSVRACQVQTPVPSSVNNTRSDVVSADIDLSSASATHDAKPNGDTGTQQANGTEVLATVANPAGSQGTFQASSLKPSGSWSVSGAAGDFTWQYPIQAPPASAGDVAPKVALSYDSQSVDGETAGTNTQTSWIGEGWDYQPGYIERTYRSCSDDTTLPKADQTGDLCWAGQVVTMDLGGQTTSLVLDDTSKTWKAQSDDGDQVSQLFGSNNGALNGEYWEVTTTDGTHYFFGRNAGPGHGSQATTNSTWTEPVFGPHAAQGSTPADPCYNAAGFAQSVCQQGWRWNLDYVEDPSGNVAMYYYSPETNYYGENNLTTGVRYTMGGTLAHIDYGMRDENGTVYASPAPDQVVFGTTERCTPSSTVNCDPSQFNATNAKNWPDTPQDQQCLSGAVCNNHSPSFWSTQRLSTITTQYANGSGGYVPVDSYALAQHFPNDGDNAMWLDSITRTGHAPDGTTIALPAVTFQGQMLDNRVPGYHNLTSMARYRLTNVTAETGEKINVSYADSTPSVPTCTTTNVPADPSTDGMLCFPVNWIPDDDSAQVLDYFQKYVTTEVEVEDGAKVSPSQQTVYHYDGTPAWHFDDIEVVKPANRTYGQFRGFGEVDVITGNPTNSYQQVPDQQTETKTTYFRGMDGDTLPGGKTRSVTVTNSLGETLPDNNFFADTAYESQVLGGINGPEVSATITNPQVLATTATRARSGLPALTATAVSDTKTRDLTDLAAGGVRTKTTTYGYDSLGRVVQKTESGDGVPDVCTTTSYADNASTWVRDKVDETVVSQQVCPAQGAQLSSIQSEDLTYYDGSSTLGAVTTGNPTRQDVATANNNGSLTVATISTSTYDASGRVLSTTDYETSGGKGNTNSIAYTPADGGNLTTTVTTNAKAQTSSVTVDPGRGTTTESVDVAGHVTDATYDPLGRLTAVWLPKQDKATGAQASETYSYLLQQNAPLAVTTNTLVDTGVGTDYKTSIDLYDSIGQKVQTQNEAETGGRSVTDTFYDSHGWVRHSNNEYNTDGAPSTTLITVAEEAVNDRTVTSYDGTGRALVATNYNGLTATDSTQTVYGGDRTTVIPPTGGITKTTLTDALDRTSAVWQYTTPPTVSGNAVSGGTYTATSYGYTPLGQQNQVTDADGNKWNFTYDPQGNKIESDDPGNGKTTYTYDLAGNLLTSTDARGQTLAYTYDELNRKIGEYSGSTSGTPLASWVYDTVQKGKLTSSTRYTPQGNFVVGIGEYDANGNPAQYGVEIPSSVTGLGGYYQTNYSYTATDLLSQLTPADGGGLPGENIVNSYDPLGNQTGSSSNSGVYLNGASYTPYNEPAQYILGLSGSGGQASLSYTHDAQTHRITNISLNANVAIPQVDNNTYGYDLYGNVTSSADVQGPAGSPTETQCYAYDALDRLNQAWTATDNCAAAPTTAAGSANIGGPNPYWQSWTIDPTGLRTAQVQHALPGATGGDTATTYAYPTPGTAQADTLTSTTTSGPNGTSTSTYGYDAAGNTTGRDLAGSQQTLTWDAENHLATDTTSAGQSTYIYDADGNQLLTEDPTSTTLYLPDEQLTYSTASQTVSGTRYYSVNNQTIAERTDKADAVFLDGDEHSNMQVVYNPDNGSVTRRTLDPYGNEVGPVTATSSSGTTTPGTWPDQRGFLNDPVDASTGLTDIGARQYDATTGRFISLDPQLNPSDPQSLTGYAYADNNPTTQSDPTGERDPYADGTPGLAAWEQSGGKNMAAWAEMNTPAALAQERRQNAQYAKDARDYAYLRAHPPVVQKPSCSGFWNCLWHKAGQVVHAADAFMQKHSTAIGIFEIGLGIASMFIPATWIFVAGMAVSAITTADSCAHKQWGSCAAGVVGMGFSGIGFKFGKVADKLAKQAAGAFKGLARIVKPTLYRIGSHIMRGVSQVYNGTSVTVGIASTAAGDNLNHR
jgi:RHS repeat-associated protein